MSLIIVIIMFLHVKIKKSKIYQEFANFCEISLFICFIFLVIIFFCRGMWSRGRGAVHGRMVVRFPLAMQFVLITSEL
jgi:hypothetical protein